MAVGVKEYAYKRSYQQISDDITPIDKHFISEYIFYLHFKVVSFFILVNKITPAKLTVRAYSRSPNIAGQNTNLPFK